MNPRVLESIGEWPFRQELAKLSWQVAAEHTWALMNRELVRGTLYC